MIDYRTKAGDIAIIDAPEFFPDGLEYAVVNKLQHILQRGTSEVRTVYHVTTSNPEHTAVDQKYVTGIIPCSMFESLSAMEESDAV